MRISTILYPRLWFFHPALLFFIVVGCSTQESRIGVDESFIAEHGVIFEGYSRGTTFLRGEGGEDLVNMYIRRTGSTLWVKPSLFFSTGEMAQIEADTYVQMTLPRSSLTVDKPYMFISHGGGYIHETRIWLQEDADVRNVVIDHNIDESSLFFLGFVGLGLGKSQVEVASWQYFPTVTDSDHSVVLVNKRLTDCDESNCAERITTLIQAAQ